MLYSLDTTMPKRPNLLFVMCIFIMIIAVEKSAVSQSFTIDCSLHFEPSDSDNTVCEGGDWGGFLQKNCCGSSFQRYLNALGLRANQTGQIFLNSSEQNSCLTSMKAFEADVFSCGIEKLTSGAGGCSDYSVGDVIHHLGNELKSFSEHCNFPSYGEEWNQTCSSCVRSWGAIRGVHSTSSDPVLLENEADTCRFAVMLSLTSSRIEDKNHVQNLYKCLAEQDSFSQNQASESKRKKKLDTGIWIVIGGIFAAIIVTAAFIFFKRFYKSKPTSKRPASFKDVQLKDPGCPKFPIKEVYSATQNLNDINLIGEGTAGKVYKGVLLTNRHVAIKHIINDGNVETFVREVASLSHVRHPNLVALLGYCLTVDEGFLIYELCPNGSLSKWLFGKDKILSWIQRLEIAIDSARGLWFLHTYSEGCIVHRDIKPTNILLGPNFEAKLSDFGLSKVIDLGKSQVSSEVRGTFGYVDPEYQSNCQVNSSGDVYRFGIVLLQILSGKKVINMNLKRPMPLNKVAKVLTRGGSIIEFADPKLNGEYSAEAFDVTLRLALSCTALKQQRPSMEQVVLTLEKALDITTTAKVSTPETSTDQFYTP
ncbi:probable LRR receptor-like serine/threonine-protein kinase MEE39 [Pistacia vera]|uniref:probable LRR receptor-like serine/threonine-protein kinase MEE39 n=1 Tax=Pistacia vera TaxID=55513 RepID=UPI001262D2E4|nr:probable LRR receptor-like serine/threonine-protein kinase MEE39 [Pistacia vera]